MTDIIPYLLGVIGFFAVYTLNGIKQELTEMKTSVRALEADLRGSLSQLDRRITHIEAVSNNGNAQQHT